MPHLILIFLVALIVLGPEKLPTVARTLSKAMFEFRRATGGFRETFEQEMRQLEREITETKSPAQPYPVSSSPPALGATPEPGSPYSDRYEEVLGASDTGEPAPAAAAPEPARTLEAASSAEPAAGGDAAMPSPHPTHDRPTAT